MKMRTLPAVVTMCCMLLVTFPLKAEIEERRTQYGKVSFRFSKWLDGSDELHLFDSDNNLLRSIPEEVSELDPTLSVEMAAYIPLGAHATNAEIEEQLVQLFNEFANAENLENLHYLNKEKKVVYPLFNRSAAIVSPHNKTVTPFQPLESRRADTMYILQSAPPFGDIILRQDMNHRNNGFLIKNLLISDMRYRGFDVITEENAITYISVVHTGISIKLYCLYSIYVQPAMRLFTRRLENSTFSRIDSLFSWIHEQTVTMVK